MKQHEQIEAAINGDKDALDELIADVYDDIYNLAVRMLWHPDDAADATQEVMIKIITKLSTFRQESSFRTWSWRIAVYHLLNVRKSRAEEKNLTFDFLADELDTLADDETLPVEIAVERKLLIEEAKIGCMQAMLLCLTRDERAVYILGEVFNLAHDEGALIFDITPAAYRKRLSRARQHIQAFMQRRCGLFNADNPCRCFKRIQIAIDQHHIHPDRLLFAQEGENEELMMQIASIDEIQRAGALYRTHPKYRSSEVLQQVLHVIDLK